MKITIGEWKTRDGRKAIVAAYNPDANKLRQFIGWVGRCSYSWTVDGRWLGDEDQHLDLIAPWAAPVPWDWSTTPPWINWICKNASGQWWATDVEPVMTQGTHWPKGTHSYIIPHEYEPKWSGDWKLSKTMRPKEVAK